MRRYFICFVLSAAIIFGMTPSVSAVSLGGISAKAYVLIERYTGTVLAAKNEDSVLPMASTTKIMTTLLLIESGNLDEEFRVDNQAIQVEGSSMGLCEDDIVTKRALCYGMMLPSGNDAANQTAVLLAGDNMKFAEMMNERAGKIGLKSTHFVTPSGLHDDNHYSTAYDMAMLTREALKDETFREICSTDSIKLKFGNPPYERWLVNSNKLLHKYENCVGVKTGFTDEAGRCLVSTAEKDGVSLICVTLNAPDDWNDHKKLYDYGFSVTESCPVEYDFSELHVDVAGGVCSSVAVEPAEIPVYTKIDGKNMDITSKVTMKSFVYAPVTENQAVGKLDCYCGERLIFSTELLTAESCGNVVAEYEPALYEKIIEYIKNMIKGEKLWRK